MYRHCVQKGFISVLFAIGSKPLQIWKAQAKSGSIKRITDEDINSLVLEILGANISTCFVSSPKDSNETFGISMPIFNLIFKNLKKCFAFEIEVVDVNKGKKRFHASSSRSNIMVTASVTFIPIRPKDGWNTLVIDLNKLMRRCYSVDYFETTRLTLYANCRVRRMYFSDRVYQEEELPIDYTIVFVE